MHKETEPNEIEAIADNEAIHNPEINAHDDEDFDVMRQELLAFNRALKPHGYSVVSLFRDLMLRMHGIRL